MGTRRESLASDNAKKIGKILRDQEGDADLYRTAVGGPSGQRTDILVGRVRYTFEDPFEVAIIATDGPFQGERSGYARREGGRWAIYDDCENEGVHYIGLATSLSLGVDVLRNGIRVATGRHDSQRLSGGTFEPYRPADAHAV